MAKYKVGDKVKIRSDLHSLLGSPQAMSGCGLIPEMADMGGREVTIEKVSSFVSGTIFYRLENESYSWHEYMFDDIAPEAKYEIGDIVKIKIEEGMHNVPRQMLRHNGKIAKIIDIKDYEDNSFALDIDNGFWNWEEHMFDDSYISYVKKQAYTDLSTKMKKLDEDIEAFKFLSASNKPTEQQAQTAIIKDYTYDSVKQYFSVTNVSTGETNTDVFIIPEKKSRIIHSENVTICLLYSGGKSYKGIAKRSPEDVDDKVKAIKIAYLRAKIKMMEKELKGLTK